MLESREHCHRPIAEPLDLLGPGSKDLLARVVWFMHVATCYCTTSLVWTIGKS